MNDWTPIELAAIILAATWLLAFLGYLADKLGPDPLREPVERRRL